MLNTYGNYIIGAFIAILLGTALIQTVANDVELAKVGSRNVSNESVTLSSGLGTLANNELISVGVCRNSTNDVITDPYCNVTLATGAVVTSGTLNFTDGAAYINYLYQPDTYVSSSSARTIITLVVLFFALGIVAIAIGLAVKSFREGKIM